MRRTRNPRIWWEYLCWQTQFWMSGHRPILPTWLRHWARHRWGGERWHITPRMIQDWIRFGGLTPEQATQPRYQPIPWPFGPAALGPFVGPWERVQHWFRAQTGGRSHRCEFTDREHGALWGHQEGAFMERIFEAFLAQLPDDPADEGTVP